MKRIFTISLLVLTGFFAKATCRIDTILNYQFVVGSSVKEIDSREINTYDASNRIVQKIYQYWDNATLGFINDSKTNSVYDASGNQTEELGQSWDDIAKVWENGYKIIRQYNAVGIDTLIINQSWLLAGSWQNSFMQSKTIDAAGNIVGGISQTWNVSMSAWQNYGKQTNTFDAAKNQTGGLSEQWNTSTSTWENLSNMTNAYDASNRIIKRVNQNWDVTTSAWRNSWLYYYTYNASGKLIEFYTQNWDVASAAWQDKTKQFKIYNGKGNIIKDSSVKALLGIWSNDELKTFAYNSSDLLTEIKTQNWNSAGSIWEQYEMRTNEYNTSKDLVAFDQFHDWNAGTSSYDNHARTEIVCTDIPTKIEEIPAPNKLNIYPNPVTNYQLFIDTKVQQDFSLFNLNGKILQTGNLKKGTNAIDVSALSPGFYFIKTDTEVKKIIIQ